MKVSVFERSLSAAILVFALPILLAAALGVLIESRHNPIFSQRRIGRHNKLITIFKLRTMHAAAPVQPTHEVGSAFVTRIGRLLRASHLDEVPQLWNVLRGEMRFVGPRPCLPIQRELIDARKQRGVDQLFPGITGLSQALGVDMSQPQRLARLDARYISRATPVFDLLIIARTLIPRRRRARRSVTQSFR